MICKEDPNAGVNQSSFIEKIQKTKSQKRWFPKQWRITDKPANRNGKTGFKYTKGQMRGRCRQLGR